MFNLIKISVLIMYILLSIHCTGKIVLVDGPKIKTHWYIVLETTKYGQANFKFYHLNQGRNLNPGSFCL